MAALFSNPFPQFFSSTPTAYSGGVLRFYASGTSTPLAVYSDSGLSSSLGTFVTLNSAGRADNAIYLSDLAYKVVLEYPSGTPIWTADPVRGRDSSLIVKTLAGSGTPNGALAGTAASAGILPDFYWDYTNAILYVCTTTGTSSTAVWTAINASAATAAVPSPQGRLTLTSVTPVLATSVSAATSVYYTPFIGNLVPLYSGSAMIPTAFAELTLSLVSQHTAGGIYDVFAFSNSGVVTLATGPVWGTLTVGAGARGTGAGTTQLTRVAGYYVNAVSVTGRNGSTTYTIAANRGTYLGSIFIDGSAGQVTCHTPDSYGQLRKWGVWNAYNRVSIMLQLGDATASWTYAVATVRQSRGDANNTLSLFCGLPEEITDIIFNQNMERANNQTASSPISMGIGVNSTTTYSGKRGLLDTFSGVATTETVRASGVAKHVLNPFIGLNTINCLEFGNATNSGTFFGGNDGMVLTAEWRG